MPKVTPLEDRYRWAPNAGSTGRYVNRATGRYVSELSVRADLDTYIVNKNAGLDALANQLRNREISLADWQLQMRNEMRNMHNAAAMVAKGGREQMTYADWGRTGRELRSQYEYLDKWAADIASGKAPIDGRLNTRATLYGDASRGTYEQQRRVMAADKGNEEECRILHSAESCDDCAKWEVNVLGWQPIGTLPKIGDSICRTRCRCTMEFRVAPQSK
jgi:hypothetical protein